MRVKTDSKIVSVGLILHWCFLWEQPLVLWDKPKSYWSQQKIFTLVCKRSLSLIKFAIVWIYLYRFPRSVSSSFWASISLQHSHYVVSKHIFTVFQHSSDFFCFSFLSPSAWLFGAFFPVLNSCDICTFQDSCRRLLVISHCSNLVRALIHQLNHHRGLTFSS